MDFEPGNVPAALLNARIMNSELFVDCLDAGKKAGTTMTLEEARRLGLIKNHWLLRVLLQYGNPDDLDVCQVQFGMNVAPQAELGSMEGRYVASSRADRDSDDGSIKPFSDIGSINKPPMMAVSDAGSVTAAVTAASADLVANSKGNGSDQAPVDPASTFSSVASSGQYSPPQLASSDGDFIHQPTKGAPVPGVFTLKLRGRATPSNAAIVIFRLDLGEGEVTFRQVLRAILALNVEPFKFRSKDFAYLGCRDFMYVSAISLLFLCFFFRCPF